MQHAEPDQLALLALGEPLVDDDRAELAAHLQHCLVCQHEVLVLRRTAELARETVEYRDEEGPRPSEAVWNGIAAELGLGATGGTSAPPAPRPADGPHHRLSDRRAEGPFRPDGRPQGSGPAREDGPFHQDEQGPGRGGFGGGTAPGDGRFFGDDPAGGDGFGGSAAAPGQGPFREGGPAGSGGLPGRGGAFAGGGAFGGGTGYPGAVRASGGRHGAHGAPGGRATSGMPAGVVGRSSGRRRWARTAVALTAAAAVGVLGTLAAVRPWEDRGPGVVAASSTASLAPVAGGPGGVSGRAVVVQGVAGPELRVSAVGLPLAQGYYEVWVFDGERRMVAVGVLGAGSTASLPLPPTLDLRTFNVVDISQEKYDGDQTHSQVSVLRGTLTS